VKDEALTQLYQQVAVRYVHCNLLELNVPFSSMVLPQRICFRCDTDAQTELLIDNEMLISTISVFLSQWCALILDSVKTQKINADQAGYISGR
jgi:hypothetical protein